MALRIKITGGQRRDPSLVVKGRCPDCGRDVTFESLPAFDQEEGAYILGQRRCPNEECSCHVFFVWTQSKVVATYPPQRIPFDRANVPGSVVETFEEAITCHAEGCYKAAAIMIRRTLEEICHDRGVAGATLKDRIRALEGKIVVPKELLEGMDELRLLGNDAAHVESRDYDAVGKEELDVAIEFAKEILKAVYQYAHLLAKLKGLKGGLTGLKKGQALGAAS